MKKSFLLNLLFILMIGTVQSQITITSDDIIPIGYTADQTIDTLPEASILEGGVGNVDWDFKALQSGLDGQFVFLQPDSTPYDTSFPSANLALIIGPELFAYLNKDDDKIEIIGIQGFQNFAGFELEGKLTLTPGQSLIRFPATFGQQFTEEIVQQGQVPGTDVGFPTIDSVRLVNTVQRSVEIDAYGTLETPSGSYETIRSTETETTEAEVFNYNNGEWVPFFTLDPDTVINYNWWTIDNGVAFPVVQLEYDPINETRRVTWLKELTDVKDIVELDAKIYPNPTSDYLNIEFKEDTTGKIELYSFNGQRILYQNIQNVFSEKINISDFNSGTYVLLLSDNHNKPLGLKKIEIVK